MIGVTSSSSNSGGGSDGTPLKMKRSASFADFSDVSKRTFQIVTEPSVLVFLFFTHGVEYGVNGYVFVLALRNVRRTSDIVGFCFYSRAFRKYRCSFTRRRLKSSLVGQVNVTYSRRVRLSTARCASLNRLGVRGLFYRYNCFGITFGLYWSVGVEFSRLLAPEFTRQ